MAQPDQPCPSCQQLNLKSDQFCRHCGEPMLVSENSPPSKKRLSLGCLIPMIVGSILSSGIGWVGGQISSAAYAAIASTAYDADLARFLTYLVFFGSAIFSFVANRMVRRKLLRRA